MSGTKIVADTNILIHLLSGRPDVVELLNGADIFMSFITEMELLSWPNITATEEAIVAELIKDCHILPLDEHIKRCAIQIRKDFKFKLPDCIVIASAISINMPLVTCDKQMGRINEAQLIILNQ